MKPNWSIQNEILKRVQREADYEWSQSPRIPVPRIKKCDIIRNNFSWRLLLKEAGKTMKELYP